MPYKTLTFKVIPQHLEAIRFYTITSVTEVIFMKLTFGLLFLALGLSACSNVKVKKYDEDQEKYLKTQNNTVNMSEYDRQRYYDRNQLGLIEPYNQHRPRK